MIQVYFFTQPSCDPCLEAKPFFYAIADRFPTVIFDEVDIRESAGNAQLAQSFEVIGTPSIVIVKDGEFFTRMPGLQSTQNGRFETALLDALGSTVPPENPGENPEGQNGSGTGKAVGLLLIFLIGLKVTNVI